MSSQLCWITPGITEARQHGLKLVKFQEFAGRASRLRFIPLLSIEQPVNTPNSNGSPAPSRACSIVSAHQECQFAERITRSCALRANRLTMSPSNPPLKLGLSPRSVFLNYQSRKHQHQRSRSRPHVFTALLDNVSDHRASAVI